MIILTMNETTGDLVLKIIILVSLILVLYILYHNSQNEIKSFKESSELLQKRLNEKKKLNNSKKKE